MPRLITIGSYVSSRKSSHGTLLSKEKGDLKRKRSEVHGIVIGSEGNRWKVRWEGGTVQSIHSSGLKFVRGEDDKSRRVVKSANLAV